MSKASVALTREAERTRLSVKVEDPRLLGKPATLTLRLRARVKDKRPVHASRTLWTQDFTLARREQHFELPADCLARCYVYAGRQLDIALESQLKIDDALLFDTEVLSDHSAALGAQPRVCSGDPQQLQPSDRFSLLANLAAIPPRNRLIAVALLVFGSLLALGNLALGVHDEFQPEARTLFYDHHGSDGSESPLLKALVGSGGLGLGAWLALQAQLRRYLRFRLRPHPPLRRGQPLRLSELVEAVARVPLQGARLRLVAGNRERGQYRRKGKRQDTTHSFSTPVSAVVLYERCFNLLPAEVPLDPYLDDLIDFDPLFDTLLPPLPIGPQHGIDVVWEVQLLHPQFVDHELAGCGESLRYEDFLPAR